MKAKNLLFSVILLGNLAVANTTVLAEESTETVATQTSSSSETGIENDTEYFAVSYCLRKYNFNRRTNN